MTKIEKLEEKLRHCVRAGPITKQDYETFEAVLDALHNIRSLLAQHPDAQIGNRIVHLAYMEADNVLEETP